MLEHVSATCSNGYGARMFNNVHLGLCFSFCDECGADVAIDDDCACFTCGGDAFRIARPCERKAKQCSNA